MYIDMYTIKYNNNLNFKLKQNFWNSLYDVFLKNNIELMIYIYILLLITTIINNKLII